VRASARIVARRDPDGVTRLTTLAGEAPLLLRRTGPRPPAARVGAAQSDPARVHLVGGAAGPLGGDELRCSVDLGPGARLEVRSVAASIALPGPHGRESTFEIRVRVAEGGSLAWSPQPLIAARGARHRTVTRIELAADARLVWRDEVVLGREGEDPGSISTRLRVTRAGQVLLDHEFAAGPRHRGSLGPAGSGGHRAIGTVLIVDPEWDRPSGSAAGFDRGSAAGSAAGFGGGTGPDVATLPPRDDPDLAVAAMRLAGPAVLITACADDLALAGVLDSACSHHWPRALA
jgi:urease accessory protein